MTLHLFITVDFTIVWDSPSYEVGEGDGITQSICATASGTLEENLVLEISVLTTDGTATGIHHQYNILCMNHSSSTVC